MAQQRRGLGRGLGALIPTAPSGGPPAQGSRAESFGPVGEESGGSAPAGESGAREGMGRGNGTGTAGAGAAAAPGENGADDQLMVGGAYFQEIAIGAITPNPRQPRQSFDEDALSELGLSIKEVGLLQPVVVRQLMPGRFELIMGERRWRACQQAGLEHIPAIVRETPDDDLLRDALMENLHREELNPLEEAAAYQQLLDDFGATHDELARKVGRSRPHISNTLRLLQLPPGVQRRVAAGVLSAGHARALLAVGDPAEQDRLAHRIIAEGLSVRAVEEIVAMGGAPGGKARRPQPKQPVAPGLRALADRLSDVFETRVKVELGRHKGKIVVEFASLDDLERIVGAMSADVGGRSAGGHAEAAS